MKIARHLCCGFRGCQIDDLPFISTDVPVLGTSLKELSGWASGLARFATRDASGGFHLRTQHVSLVVSLMATIHNYTWPESRSHVCPFALEARTGVKHIVLLPNYLESEKMMKESSH